MRVLLKTVSTAAGLMVCAKTAFASGFQLWEQDGASIGHYHAGYAAEAADASTSFYNPAGMTRIKEQELVISGDTVATDLKYEGTVSVNTILAGIPRPVTAQGGNVSVIPALHYVTPLTDDLHFGFSVTVPFGLKTTWGRKTILRYAATTTATTVVDVSPALSYDLTEKHTIGAGFDIAQMNAEFDQVGGLGFPTMDAEGINKKVSGTGYGYHLGWLFQLSQTSRAGVSYHSQIVQHLNGISSFVGPLATAFAGGPFSSQGYTNITLPPYTALSAYHDFLSGFSLMGSIVHTQWNTIRTISMYDVTGILNLAPSSNLTVTIPEYFRNTWNIAVGLDYMATENIKLRSGLGFDQSPVVRAYRNIMMPDSNRVAVALGGHYQASNKIGLDLGWTHVFMNQAAINPPPQVSGDQSVITNGNVNGGADVLAAQVTWQMT